MLTIKRATPAEYENLLRIWEDSVRATHTFIGEEEIESFKPMILQYGFPAVDLLYGVEGDTVVGFMGVLDRKIEMLFLSPAFFKKGFGRELLLHAVDNMGAEYVDVNEQNPQACEFYEYMGFEVIKRSPLDAQGNPFPILHMKLKR